MPEYVVNRVGEALNAQRKAINGSKVLIVGLAYKADVDDDRESPSYVLMTLLKARGATVGYYDPYVPVIRPTREHPQFAGIKSVAWDKETLGGLRRGAHCHQTCECQLSRTWRMVALHCGHTQRHGGNSTRRAGQVWKA